MADANPLDQLVPRDLRVYREVVRLGSMTRAANATGNTQPFVSAVVTRLELALGGKLLDRGFRPLQPTPLGRLLYEHAIRVLDQYDELSAALVNLGSASRASLRIGMISSLSAGSGELFRQLMSSRTRISISSGLTPELNEQLRYKTLDILITSDPAFQDYSPYWRQLFSEELLLVRPAKGDIVQVQNLTQLSANFPLIAYTPRSRLGWTIKQYIDQYKFPVRESIEMDSSVRVISAVASGVGWAISTPTCLLESGIPLNLLRLSRLEAVPSHRDIFIATSRRNTKTAANEIGTLVLQHVHAELNASFFGANAWISARCLHLKI